MSGAIHSLFTRLRGFLDDLSLAASLGLALVAGLAVPLTLATLVHFSQQRAALLERQAYEHAQMAQVLAVGMQTPLWEIRPETGRALLEALMLDPRVVSLKVDSSLMPDFLALTKPGRQGRVAVVDQPVLRGDEVIGRVRVVMDTGHIATRLARQWVELAFSGVMQLLTGLTIAFLLLRYKVLSPIARLVGQTRLLAGGILDRPLTWQRGDELGELGRSFEDTRRALLAAITDLDRRNRELQARESELARQAQVLRATLDNMTDGITLVDADLNLVAWNQRFIELLDMPRELVRAGVPLLEVTREHLNRQGYSIESQDTFLAPLRDSFLPGRQSTTQTRLRKGRRIEIRRRPVPEGGFVSTYTDITDQIEAQRRADESRQLLEAVMDSVPALIHVKDRDLRYRMVNRRCLDHWHLTRERMIGHTSGEVFPEVVHRTVEREDRQVLETGRPRPFYEINYQDDAGPHTLWSTKVPLRDANGEINHIVTVDIDITQRKEAEQERQRWLRLFQDAIESLPNGFAIYDANERLEICNTAFAALYDLEPDRLVGETAADIRRRGRELIESVDGEDPWASDPAIQRLRIKGGEPMELRLKDGRWLLGSYHPTAEGGVVYVRTDITRLKRMEQALRDSERRFRSIAEAHPVPVIITTLARGRLLYVSPGMADLIRAPAPAIIANGSDALFQDPEDRIRLREQLLARGQADGFECLMRRADGSTFPAAINARRMDYLGADGAVGGIIDLTERKRDEAEIARQREALHQSEKLTALGSLLAGVAHELNNPLSVVVGRSIMLEETAPAEIRQPIEKIRGAAERCARIVKTFLAIARQQPPQRSQVQLNELVQSALELVDYGLDSAGVERVLDLDPGLPEVFADGDQLTQVFSNLAVNARQALEEVAGPRRLTITTRHLPREGMVTIAFTDNGPGVPEAIRSRIFEPFYTSKPEGAGTGIGLSFSHGVVTSHGGTIRLEDSPGGGARFVIRLPVSDSNQGLEPVPGTPPAPPRQRRILVVDDEPGINELLEEILAGQGHRVDSAASGNQALELIAHRDYDLILSDLKMPDLDGPGLFERLCREKPALAGRVIFISGDTLSPGTGEFLERSGRPLVEKPFVPEEILGLVRRVLGED